MSGFHARLGPSGAHRWMVCPGSVQLSESLSAPSTSVYAEEGTRAHERAEIEARHAFGLLDREGYEERLAVWQGGPFAVSDVEMSDYAREYVALIADLIGDYRDPILLFEEQVDTGVPGSWGTTDCLLAMPRAGKLIVVDYKYGMGVRVDATENPQLMLYGVGALERVSEIGDFDSVDLVVHQPRLDHISSWTVHTADLLAWRDREVVPAAALALSQNAYFRPTESACRFCPASGRCTAQMEAALDRDFGDPKVLTPEMVADALAAVDGVEAWCKALREVAVEQMYAEGVEIPGWKVVRSGGIRKILDSEAAIDKLVQTGIERERIVKESLETLANLDRAVGGKTRLAELLGPLMGKTEGKLSAMPETDPRPAETAQVSAMQDFG